MKVSSLAHSYTSTLMYVRKHSDLLLRFALSALGILILSTVLGCAGGNSTVSGPAPTIMSFNASPTAITTGQSTVLSWSVIDAATLSITFNGGTVNSSNSTTLSPTSVAVSPTATTVYMLTATNSAGATVTATITVNVGPPPFINSFTASPSVVTPGQNVTLSWSVDNAASFAINDVPVNGNSIVVNPTATSVYQLTAFNAAGLASYASISVTVVPPPIISAFTATPSTVSNGQSSTLSWSVSGATGLSIDNGVGPVTGSSVMVSPTSATTYTLTASNTVGSFTATSTAQTNVTFSNVAVPTITSFTYDVPSVGPGGNANLTGVFSFGAGGGTATVDNGVGTVVSGQSANTGPLSASTTFTLTVTNVDTNSVTAQVRVIAGSASVFAGKPGFSGSADNVNPLSARFNAQQGLALDKNGNMYVADTNNNILRMITPAGDVTTIAGDSINNNPGYTGDGGLAINATLNAPQAVAVDGNGNIYIADTGNSVIREISAGTINTIAGTGTPGYNGDGIAINTQLSSPEGVAVDVAGANVYVADTNNDLIRVISSGSVTTLAGTPQTPGNTDNPALFNAPQGVTVDGAGKLYIADTLNNTIRTLSGGTVHTLAGSAGVQGHADGTGSAATFYHPYAIGLDTADNCYVADNQNFTIRRISSSGVVSTIIGKPLVAHVTTPGGALPGIIAAPRGIAVDTVNGKLYFSLPDAILTSPY